MVGLDLVLDNTAFLELIGEDPAPEEGTVNPNPNRTVTVHRLTPTPTLGPAKWRSRTGAINCMPAVAGEFLAKSGCC